MSREDRPAPEKAAFWLDRISEANVAAGLPPLPPMWIDKDGWIMKLEDKR